MSAGLRAPWLSVHLGRDWESTVEIYDSEGFAIHNWPKRNSVVSFSVIHDECWQASAAELPA